LIADGAIDKDFLPEIKKIDMQLEDLRFNPDFDKHRELNAKKKSLVENGKKLKTAKDKYNKAYSNGNTDLAERLYNELKQLQVELLP